MNTTKRFSGLSTMLWLAMVGALVFIPFLGHVHLFDWDEINFAESAREMIVTGNYQMVQINFQPFYEKPPLFIWLQALSMSYLGVNEFAARLPNAIIGIITLLTVYWTGKRYFTAQMGIWWAMLFTCSVLPQLYFKSGIIDPLFNYFIFLSILMLYHISVNHDNHSPTSRSNHLRYIIISAFAAGLAVLTKGPVALGLIALIVIIMLLSQRPIHIRLTRLVIWLVTFAIVIAAWLAFEISAQGFTFIHQFITYQIRLLSTEDAGHGGPICYHLLVILLGCFPASILAMYAFSPNQADSITQKSFKRWMIVMLLVVLCVFSIVKTKILHYSSLCYFPVTFLGAYYIHHLVSGRYKWSWRQAVPIALLGGTLGIAVTIAIYLGISHYPIPLGSRDMFAAEAVKAAVSWNIYEIAIPILYLIAIGIALYMLIQQRVHAGISIILVATGLFVHWVMILIAPRIEQYSQAEMITFLQSKSTEDCYVEVMGFKSYAQLFYLNKKKPATNQELDPNYLLSATLTKPLYIITKVNHTADFTNQTKYQELYRKNGFVFYKKLL
jgi:4-amino-4-deoxy-L-arabinose transferase-like glycosyltransferase